MCLGNNSLDTDNQTTNLAQQDSSVNFGLITDIDSEIQDGYYHSSLYDIEFGNLLLLAQKFDEIRILDQLVDQWEDRFSYDRTISLANKLEKTKKVIWMSDVLANNPKKQIEKVLDTNKSLCIAPFIELMTENNATTLCCHSSVPIKKLNDIVDWPTDKEYSDIRQKMIKGIKLPEHCKTCYSLEDKGILSPRIKETLEWVDRLGINSVEDFAEIKHPLYYEVRASNVCNLQCRMCSPKSSNLIEKEYKEIGLYTASTPIEYTNFDFVDIDNIHRLYVAGGEPTAQIEFYTFLEKCIEQNKTTFEMTVNTNATRINDRLRKLLRQFKNVNLNVSIDGYDAVNYYVRWPSDWQILTDNLRKLLDDGNSLTFATVLSIYNISNSYKLFEFFDKEYPRCLVDTDFVVSPNDILTPYIFPNQKLALDNLTKITLLNSYKNNLNVKDKIDNLIEYFSKPMDVDLDKLKKFFEFNDLLDQSRNIRLRNYIPELDDCRRYVL